MDHLTDAQLRARLNDLKRETDNAYEVWQNLVAARERVFHELSRRSA